MPKKSFDLMKWWPLLTALIVLIANCAIADYKLTEHAASIQKQWEIISSLRDRVTRLER